MRQKFTRRLETLFILGYLTATLQAQDPPQYEVESELVQVPVVVVDREGNLYGGLKKSSFEIYEDRKPQEILAFSGGEAKLTLVLLLENSRMSRYLLSEVLRPAAVLVSQILQREDYAAIVSFDNEPRVVADFTRNRQKLMNGVNELARDTAVFHESNLFEALEFTLQGGTLEYVEYKGLAGITGRTGVLVIATGSDTMSSLNFQDTREIVANSGVPIYSIAIGELLYTRADPFLSGPQRLEFLQARNHLSTFSRESGGHFYAPRFSGAIDEILESIANMLRFQYALGYRPADSQNEGKREIEVRVDIDGDGEPEKDLALNYRRFYYPEEEK
jgi:VWFA-related protein